MKKRFELVDLFEPVFDEVCRLNKLWSSITDSGVKYTSTSLKESWRKIFQQIDKRVRAQEDPRLLSSYRELRPAVVHFVDEFIISHKLSELSDWKVNPLATDPFVNGEGVRSVEGANEFFVRVEKDIALAPENPAAKERLAVCLTCLGFGFKGKYYNDSTKLGEVVARIQQEIPDHVHLDFNVGIFRGKHKAYVVPMPPKPTRWVPWVAVSLLILSVALLVGYFAVYYGQYGELRKDLRTILSDVAGKK